jgi:ribonuclease HI
MVLTGCHLPLKKLVQWTVDIAHDLCFLISAPRPKGIGVIRKWSVPPDGWIKCNIDGAFYTDMGQGATGVVLWDHACTFRGGKTQWYRHGLNALSMEATACRDGVVLAGEMNFRRVQVETDSQELVKLWEMGELQRSCISPIIGEIRELSVSFVDFSLVYVNRACNSVAHTLAKKVSDGNRVGEWQLAPTCIANLLTEDCNHVCP